jgi:hypothetical protein
MAVAPWIVSDELWGLVEPLLPKRERRFRYPGRKRLPDRQALQGVLFVLHTGDLLDAPASRTRLWVRRAWLHQFKRLLVRYDRRADIHAAFLALGCCTCRFAGTFRADDGTRTNDLLHGKGWRAFARVRSCSPKASV